MAAGTSTPASMRSHSAAGLVARHAPIAPISHERCARRPELSVRVGSAARSDKPTAAQKRSHIVSLPIAMTMVRSAVSKGW